MSTTFPRPRPCWSNSPTVLEGPSPTISSTVGPGDRLCSVDADAAGKKPPIRTTEVPSDGFSLFEVVAPPTSRLSSPEIIQVSAGPERKLDYHTATTVALNVPAAPPPPPPPPPPPRQRPRSDDLLVFPKRTSPSLAVANGGDGFCFRRSHRPRYYTSSWGPEAQPPTSFGRARSVSECYASEFRRRSSSAVADAFRFYVSAHNGHQLPERSRSASWLPRLPKINSPKVQSPLDIPEETASDLMPSARRISVSSSTSEEAIQAALSPRIEMHRQFVHEPESSQQPAIPAPKALSPCRLSEFAGQAKESARAFKLPQEAKQQSILTESVEGELQTLFDFNVDFNTGPGNAANESIGEPMGDDHDEAVASIAPQLTHLQVPVTKGGNALLIPRLIVAGKPESVSSPQPTTIPEEMADGSPLKTAATAPAAAERAGSSYIPDQTQAVPTPKSRPAVSSQEAVFQQSTEESLHGLLGQPSSLPPSATPSAAPETAEKTQGKGPTKPRRGGGRSRRGANTSRSSVTIPRRQLATQAATRGARVTTHTSEADCVPPNPLLMPEASEAKIAAIDGLLESWLRGLRETKLPEFVQTVEEWKNISLIIQHLILSHSVRALYGQAECPSSPGRLRSPLLAEFAALCPTLLPQNSNIPALSERTMIEATSLLMQIQQSFTYLLHGGQRGSGATVPVASANINSVSSAFPGLGKPEPFPTATGQRLYSTTTSSSADSKVDDCSTGSQPEDRTAPTYKESDDRGPAVEVHLDNYEEDDDDDFLVHITSSSDRSKRAPAEPTAPAVSNTVEEEADHPPDRPVPAPSTAKPCPTARRTKRPPSVDASEALGATARKRHRSGSVSGAPQKLESDAMAEETTKPVATATSRDLHPETATPSVDETPKPVAQPTGSKCGSSTVFCRFHGEVPRSAVTAGTAEVDDPWRMLCAECDKEADEFRNKAARSGWQLVSIGPSVGSGRVVFRGRCKFGHDLCFDFPRLKEHGWCALCFNRSPRVTVQMGPGSSRIHVAAGSERKDPMAYTPYMQSAQRVIFGQAKERFLRGDGSQRLKLHQQTAPAKSRAGDTAIPFTESDDESAGSVERLITFLPKSSPWQILALGPAPRRRLRQTDELFIQAKARYRRWVRRVHPDKNRHPRAKEAFHILDSAWKDLESQAVP